jgi:hypothetical protein
MANERPTEKIIMGKLKQKRDGKAVLNLIKLCALFMLNERFSINIGSHKMSWHLHGAYPVKLECFFQTKHNWLLPSTESTFTDRSRTKD